MRYLFLLLTFAFTTELEVDGNLKVTGTVDANGNTITNVGEPILTSDVATANYVNSRTASKGRIIEVKCAWHIHSNAQDFVGTGSCDPPECPDGWSDLIIYNEVTSGWASSQYISTHSNYGYYTDKTHVVGNSIRYCIEQEDSE